MKTIAISIDQESLDALDRLRKERKGGSRSLLVREAVAVYVAGELKREKEARDAEIYRRMGPSLDRKLRALVRAQATP